MTHNSDRYSNVAVIFLPKMKENENNIRAPTEFVVATILDLLKIKIQLISASMGGKKSATEHSNSLAIV